MDIFKSRTVLVFLFMVVTTVVNSSTDLLPPDVFVLTQAILAALGTYFRINPKQNFDV